MAGKYQGKNKTNKPTPETKQAYNTLISGIKEQMEKQREMKKMKDALNATFPAHTDSLNPQYTGKPSPGRVKQKGQQALDRIKSGHADEYENWWEHDPLPDKFNKRRKNK